MNTQPFTASSYLNSAEEIAEFLTATAELNDRVLLTEAIEIAERASRRLNLGSVDWSARAKAIFEAFKDAPYVQAQGCMSGEKPQVR